MKSRAYLKDVCTKATPVISTAYSTKENGYAVYIYVMEYGHVYQGESSESTNGYADIFVIKDSKEKGTSIVFKMRPDPAQFCYQSFSISKNGYVLIRNDSILLCYGVENRYTAEGVSSSIERFLSMYDDGNVNYRDYQRIISRYSELSEDDKAKVTNYSKLEGVCVTLRLETVSKDIVIKVPKGSMVDIPDVAVPKGKVLTGWMDGKSAWTFFNTPVMKVTVLTPVYADAVTIKLNPQNGASAYEIQSAKGSELPFIYDPSKDGYQFGGWYDGSTLYKPNETKVSKNVTLTAKWLEVSLLKFDTDGGSPVTGKYYGIYDKPLGNLPVSVKAGYTFKGWYYDGKEYTSQTVYKFNDSITLKAKWAENTSTTIENTKEDADSIIKSISTETKAADGNESKEKKVEVESKDGNVKSVVEISNGADKADIITTVKTDSNDGNNAVTKEQIEQAIVIQGKVSDEIKDDVKDHSKVIQIESSAPDASLTVPKDAIKAASDANSSLRIVSEKGSIAASDTVLSNMLVEEEITTSISEAKDEHINNAQRENIPDGAVVVDVRIMAGDKDLGKSLGGLITISIRYTPADGKIGVAYHIDDDGNKVRMGGIYDPIKGEIVFDSTHCSLYMVVDEDPSKSGLSNATIFVGIAVAVVAAIAVVIMLYVRKR